MASAARSSGQSGSPALGGLAHMAIMTITPGTTATAGENLDLTSYFSTVDGIVYMGSDDADTAKYVPKFSFTPGAATTPTSIKFYMMITDGDAGTMEPDNGTNLSGSTIQVLVFGKHA